MARRTPQLRMLSATTLVLCFHCSAGAVTPSDEIMSSASRGYLSIADYEALSANWERTQFGQLAKDDAMQPFVHDMRRQLQQKLAGVRDSLGLRVTDLRGVASGEIGVALVERENARAAVALTADVSGRIAAAEELLAKVDRDLIQQRAVSKKLQSAGVTLTHYAIPPQSDDDIAREAVFFIHQDMLCGCDSRDEAEEMIQRFGGQGGDRLVDVPAYRETMQRCAAEAGQLAPEARWYVNPFGYARASRTLVINGQPRRGKDYVEILQSQGFDAIQGMGGFINIAVYGSFELLHRTSIYAPPLPGEIDKYRLAMRMMQFPNGADLEPQGWIPRHLASYRTFNMDLQNAFEHFDTLFDAIAGHDDAFADVIEGLEIDPYGPQVKVKSDFVDHLGQRVTMVTDYVTPITTKSERFLFVVEVKDEQAVQGAVQKFMKADPNAHLRVVEGREVWEIAEPQSDIPELDIPIDLDPLAENSGALTAGAPSALSSAVCVADGNLLVASHFDFLERVLHAKQQGDLLADAGDFREVEIAMQQLMNGPICARCFLRTDEAYRPTYELLRQGKMPESETLFGRLLNRLLTPVQEEEEGILRQQKIDGKQLPNFEMVRRYFSPAGTVVRAESDGWFVVGATLTKQAAAQASVSEPGARR